MELLQEAKRQSVISALENEINKLGINYGKLSNIHISSLRSAVINNTFYKSFSILSDKDSEFRMSLKSKKEMVIFIYNKNEKTLTQGAVRRLR